MQKEMIWFIPAILVTLGIFALSTFLALPFQIEDVSHLDKWEHTFAYFVLSFSFLFAFKKSGRLTSKISLSVLLIVSVYGLALEFAQFQFFTYRFFEWADALANVLGAVLGYLLFLLAKRGISG